MFKATLWLVLALAAQTASANGRFIIHVRENASLEIAEAFVSGLGFDVKERIPEVNTLVIQARSLDARVVDLSSAPIIDSIERDEVLEIEPGVDTAVAKPNDRLFKEQDWASWLDLREAWSLSTGSRDVIVAITDTGLDAKHPDLRGQLWTNQGEIPGNFIDDDGNGLIDDVHGWNYFENNADIADTYGEVGHGTEVAGIIGAAANNARGISGINWNVRLMPLRTCGGEGKCSTSANIKAILYAVKNGARLINASWGTEADSPSLRYVIDYAFNHGVLFVAAAGNKGRNIDLKPYFPSSHRKSALVSVAAIRKPNRLVGFSNSGVTTVHLAAPGDNVITSARGGVWREVSGTSFACPMVTGVGALIAAYRPELTARELRNALINASVPRSRLFNKVSTGGELNAALALKQFAGGFQVWPSRLTLRPGDSFTFTTNGAKPARWMVSDSSVAKIDESGELTVVRPGSTFVVAQDAKGNTAASASVRVLLPQSIRKGD